MCVCVGLCTCGDYWSCVVYGDGRDGVKCR